MIGPRQASLAAALLFGACAASASAPAPVSAPGARVAQGPGAHSDADRVQRLFRARCLTCHGGIRQQGGLSLLRRERAVAAAASGKAAVVPRAPEASESPPPRDRPRRAHARRSARR